MKGEKWREKGGGRSGGRKVEGEVEGERWREKGEVREVEGER